MAGFTELGLNPGDALPAPSTASVTNGMHLGANGLWQYPPGYLLAAPDLGTAYSNSAAETSILSAGAITNLFPAGVAVGDTVDIRAGGTYLNNSAANQTLTLNLYMGSTVIATATSPNVATSGTARNWQLEVEVIFTIIGGAGAGAIRPVGRIAIGTGVGTGYQGLTAAGNFFVNNGASATIATNATANVDLKAQLSAATATQTVTCNIFRARYFPRNW